MPKIGGNRWSDGAYTRRSVSAVGASGSLGRGGGGGRGGAAHLRYHPISVIRSSAVGGR